MTEDLEAIVDEIHREHVAGFRRRVHVEQNESVSKVRTGRPPRLKHSDEWELYCYRKSGVSIRTCASMWRVSVPTANRIIAKFRKYDEAVEPVARQFRDILNSPRD